MRVSPSIMRTTETAEGSTPAAAAAAADDTFSRTFWRTWTWVCQNNSSHSVLIVLLPSSTTTTARATGAKRLVSSLYQSWMADTDFSTVNAVCAASSDGNDT
jgi:hypothetical protein